MMIVAMSIFAGSLNQGVGLKESVDGGGGEGEADDSGYNYANDLERLHPSVIAPANCLEHAPKAVHKV